MYFPLPDGDPCFFCEIIEGNSNQWQVIEQTDLTMTLLNGRQFEVGQCVVVPTRHAPTLLDLNEVEVAAVMAAAKRITKVMVEAFAPDGVLLYQNNGVGSGQEVPHFHLHVVPRRAESDWGFGPPHIARLEKEGRAKHVDHLLVTDAKLQTIEDIRRHL
jgi:diadenosine tetraphosphate (Ap4A) HIT family hydrolase